MVLSSSREPQILFLLHALGLLKLGQDRCHRLLRVVVCSHDGGEGLVESGFPWPVRPLSHGSPPSSRVFLCLRPLDRVPTAPRSLLLLGWWGYPGFPVVVDTQLIDVSWGRRCVYLELSNVAGFCMCVCILSAAVCSANGIPRLKDRGVDSWVVIAWAYFCWRDGGGFVFTSLSLTFGVADLCGSLNFVGFRDVGHNSCGGILRRCVGGVLHDDKRLLPPML
ncbi:hypothetical protein NDU88_001996 [Pleurodeles waltl]|uniref:Uncharacterized protein n=1 Tax=Pleurodeles waltl TaxID=8319 RepID=A0AAV7VDC3_PLEWA|nr:hypothetical protein NDU88_001996 [Pleurodeles waltl]